MDEQSKEYLAFKSYLDIQPAIVRNNTEIVCSADLDIKYMLHIDKKAPSKMIPMMPRRAADSENNTTPRITVADTLIGCMIGYGSLLTDFTLEDVPGYYISSVDFNYCLRVTNNKLVFDGKITNEHWLLGYSKETLSYPLKVIGKFFMDGGEQSKFTIKDKKDLSLSFWTSIILYMELEQEIFISTDLKISPGFYRITFKKNEQERGAFHHILGSYDLKPGPLVEQIGKAEFMKYKNKSASMLSAEVTNIPLYKNW